MQLMSLVSSLSSFQYVSWVVISLLVALDYEGIYRKTGGSGLSKTITHLFERGDYDSFDLRDSDKFNDISSVTSVLKTYFRSLPDPLFTYALHEDFVQASQIRDPAAKSSVLSELVFRLPPEHLHTAKLLMMHLHRVSQQSEVNLMTARNLGVVFGREFSDCLNDVMNRLLSLW